MLRDHLGSEIRVGSCVFWPLSYSNSVSHFYGRVHKITENKNGQFSITVKRQGKVWDSKKRQYIPGFISKTCRRIDLMTVISPEVAKPILEKHKDRSY